MTQLKHEEGPLEIEVEEQVHEINLNASSKQCHLKTLKLQRSSRRKQSRFQLIKEEDFIKATIT